MPATIGLSDGGEIEGLDSGRGFQRSLPAATHLNTGTTTSGPPPPARRDAIPGPATLHGAHRLNSEGWESRVEKSERLHTRIDLTHIVDPLRCVTKTRSKREGPCVQIGHDPRILTGPRRREYAILGCVIWKLLCSAHTAPRYANSIALMEPSLPFWSL